MIEFENNKSENLISRDLFSLFLDQSNFIKYHDNLISIKVNYDINTP